MSLIFAFCLQIILILSWANHEPLKKGDYEYPEWANAIGYIIALVAILAVPFVAIWQIAMKIKQEKARTPGVSILELSVKKRF